MLFDCAAGVNCPIVKLSNSPIYMLPARTRRDTYTGEDGYYHLAHSYDDVHPVKFLLFHNDIFIFYYFMVGVDLLKLLNS